MIKLTQTQMKQFGKTADHSKVKSQRPLYSQIITS